MRVCFIRPSRVIISSNNNTSYDLNREEFNVLLAVAVLACTQPWISSEMKWLFTSKDLHRGGGDGRGGTVPKHLGYVAVWHGT